MTTVTWVQLSQKVLTGAAAQQFATSAGQQTSIQAATAWNPTGAPVTVQVWVVPPSGSASDATRVSNVQVGAGATQPLYDLLNHKVPPGGSVQALGNGVTLTLSGAQAQ